MGKVHDITSARGDMKWCMEHDCYEDLDKVRRDEVQAERERESKRAGTGDKDEEE